MLFSVNDRDVPANVATRARIVLWYAEGRQKKEVAELAGVRGRQWICGFPLRDRGIGGFVDRSRAAPREQVPARIGAGSLP